MIFWLQKFSNQLGNKNFTNIIKFILDDHVRIGQIHSRYTKAEKVLNQVKQFLKMTTLVYLE